MSGHAKFESDPIFTQHGFTLVELLIIIAILASLAGGVIMAYENVEDDAGVTVAQTEMARVKEAILKFRQDTGYLPKQGPFELAAAAGAPCVATNLNGSAPLPAGKTREWYCSPVNVYQLYENPLAGTGHPLAIWNPDTGRGWRGPYLTRFGEGLVDVGDGLNQDGAGCPTVGAAELQEVRAVAGPFLAAPVAATLGGAPVILLEWRTLAGGTAHPRWGRPYLLFDLQNTTARLVSMGPDRTYDGCPGGTGDDLVLDLLQ